MTEFLNGTVVGALIGGAVVACVAGELWFRDVRRVLATSAREQDKILAAWKKSTDEWVESYQRAFHQRRPIDVGAKEPRS